VLIAISGGRVGIFVVICERLDEHSRRLHARRRRVYETSIRSPAMATPAALPNPPHDSWPPMPATGLGVRGIHAFLLLKGRHQRIQSRRVTIA